MPPEVHSAEGDENGLSGLTTSRVLSNPCCHAAYHWALTEAPPHSCTPVSRSYVVDAIQHHTTPSASTTPDLCLKSLRIALALAYAYARPVPGHRPPGAVSGGTRVFTGPLPETASISAAEAATCSWLRLSVDLTQTRNAPRKAGASGCDATSCFGFEAITGESLFVGRRPASGVVTRVAAATAAVAASRSVAAVLAPFGLFTS
ncbi:hypothetical protein CORC01_08312 [Colletotrichum orchidophilum]|uniref:Uncharacterized protein n=1 Tax=Colletotrichum orchidophilum TaxID=1209926 RepID=A0A1G4B4N9_9PEZI|nr:uncharacterized protein CORC01_08312 [Colletotrichum orchidophilum]OHE96389.1 hypothetical protein CORC01_08312 [Colletotrichum orchidophilum]